MKQPNYKQLPLTTFGQGSACETLLLIPFFLALASTKEHNRLYVGMGNLLIFDYVICG